MRDEGRWWLNTAEGDLGRARALFEAGNDNGLDGDPSEYYTADIAEEWLDFAARVLAYARGLL